MIGADFYDAAPVFEELINTILQSKEEDAASVPEQESLDLLTELRRLDRDFPTLEQAARVQPSRRGYATAASGANQREAGRPPPAPAEEAPFD